MSTNGTNILNGKERVDVEVFLNILYPKPSCVMVYFDQNVANLLPVLDYLAINHNDTIDTSDIDTKNLNTLSIVQDHFGIQNCDDMQGY